MTTHSNEPTEEEIVLDWAEKQLDDWKDMFMTTFAKENVGLLIKLKARVECMKKLIELAKTGIECGRERTKETS